MRRFTIRKKIIAQRAERRMVHLGEQDVQGTNIAGPFLNTSRKERVPVSIFLVNGIKLQGQIELFDQFVILLSTTTSQMVYKSAISTVVPSRNVKIPLDDED